MPKITNQLNLPEKPTRFLQDQVANLPEKHIGLITIQRQIRKDLRLPRNNKLAQDNKHLLVPQTLVITTIEYKEMLLRTPNTNMADQETNQVNIQN